MRPKYFEMSFGLGDTDEKSLETLHVTRRNQTLSFRGRMDRVDVDEKRKRALVVDYKTSEGFSLTKFQKGQNPQALIYYLAIQELLDLESIGTEFFAIKDKKRGGFLRRDYYDEEKPRNRLKSTLNADEFSQVLEDALRWIFEDVKKLRAGYIAADSITCRNCDYYSLCRFEGWKWKR